MVENITELLAHHGALAFVGAFGIGVLTSVAPCSIVTLPLLVGSALQLENDIDKSKKSAFTIRYSLLFVVGLVLALSILAFLVAKFSYFFSIAPFWAYLLAALVALLIGLQGIGVLPISIPIERRDTKTECATTRVKVAPNAVQLVHN